MHQYSYSLHAQVLCVPFVYKFSSKQYSTGSSFSGGEGKFNVSSLNFQGSSFEAKLLLNFVCVVVLGGGAATQIRACDKSGAFVPQFGATRPDQGGVSRAGPGSGIQ